MAAVNEMRLPDFSVCLQAQAGIMPLKGKCIPRVQRVVLILHNPLFSAKAISMNSKRKQKSDRTGKHAHLLYGSLCGFLNGLFGSGGGTVAVPAFEKNGTEPKKAHASSVALIFVLSLVTAVIYLMNGKLDFGTAWEYIPYGLIGAILGSFLLGKIPDRLIRIIFGLLMIASGVRMIL